MKTLLIVFDVGRTYKKAICPIYRPVEVAVSSDTKFTKQFNKKITITKPLKLKT